MSDDSLAAIATRLESGEALPGELGAAALALGTRIYAAAVQRGEGVPPALTQDVTATDVVVAVSAMLRAAGLNSFDLAMWFNREEPSRRP